MTPLESKNNFGDLFNIYPQAVAVSDTKMARFINVNDKFCELTQYTRKEILGATIAELGIYSEQDRKRFIHELNMSGEINGFEKDFKLKDNSSVNTIMFARLITNDRERYVLNTFCDVTERIQLEALAQQAGKNEAIATLAGGIAHEFNNALAVISGNIELLRMELSDNEEVEKYGEAMIASVQRMSKITGRFLAYARGGKYQEKTISLSGFVEEILPILNRTIDPSISIDTDLPEDIPGIKADCAQIQMILSDILINASEAMEGGGKIRISTREEKIDEAFAGTNPDLKPGHYVCLTIEDDGKGMAEETKKRIFEPFFTTKFHGRGLGMAAAYGIVKNHGGGIYVDSKLGNGTKVQIYLPAIDEDTKELKKPMDETAIGSGAILVIEDNESEKLRELIDRRRDNRFEVVRGAVAIHKNDHSKQGQIIDISKGGLAFCYDESEDLTKEFAEFAISFAAGDFYLDKIPCKVISYCSASDIIPLNHENMRRVGVQLGELTQKQTDQLEYFIRNHTANQV
ncbi:MAG: PAS domain S-box protein [Deltaproteobacteria bacterium]|nr:PAS domain S-box protein [Deltaproteobacteria bacterium]